MNRIREYRIRLGLTQKQLAARVGIPRARLSEYENGRRAPSPETRAKLAKEFPDAPDLLSTLDHLPKEVFHALSKLEPWPRSPDYREVWHRTRRVHQEALQKLGHVDVPELFESSIRCDSTYEPCAMMQVIKAGARAYVCSPHAVGFDLHPIVDEFNRSAGARLMPCLYLLLQSIHMLFFPQVSLRPKNILYRVDMLLLVVAGKKRFWFVVEIDGPGHNGYNDDVRKQDIGMEIIRVPGLAVTNLTFLAYLINELKQHGVPFK
jgi:transcriptional regulator with XRE-family HTH domain